MNAKMHIDENSIINNKEIQDAFKKEAHDLINRMKKDLILMRNKKSDGLFSLFRSAHTLRSITGCVGFYEMENYSKAILEITRAAKDKKIIITSEINFLLLGGIEACKKLLESKKNQNNEKLLKQLKDIQGEEGDGRIKIKQK